MKKIELSDFEQLCLSWLTESWELHEQSMKSFSEFVKTLNLKTKPNDKYKWNILNQK